MGSSKLSADDVNVNGIHVGGMHCLRVFQDLTPVTVSVIAPRSCSGIGDTERKLRQLVRVAVVGPTLVLGVFLECLNVLNLAT